MLHLRICFYESCLYRSQLQLAVLLKACFRIPEGMKNLIRLIGFIFKLGAILNARHRSSWPLTNTGQPEITKDRSLKFIYEREAF